MITQVLRDTLSEHIAQFAKLHHAVNSIDALAFDTLTTIDGKCLRVGIGLDNDRRIDIGYLPIQLGYDTLDALRNAVGQFLVKERDMVDKGHTNPNSFGYKLIEYLRSFVPDF